jgi:hypothetical protein
VGTAGSGDDRGHQWVCRWGWIFVGHGALSTNRAGDITYADAHLGLVASASEDMQEAVAAFREKREGKFQNR